MAIRVWRILADLGLLGPKSASVFLTTLFFLRAYQHETFKDQSAMLGEHLSQKLMPAHTYNPIFGHRRLNLWARYAKSPPKNIIIFFFFSELQELEVQICVQPNFPIIILILLTGFINSPDQGGLTAVVSCLLHVFQFLWPRLCRCLAIWSQSHLLIGGQETWPSVLTMMSYVHHAHDGEDHNNAHTCILKAWSKTHTGSQLLFTFDRFYGKNC